MKPFLIAISFALPIVCANSAYAGLGATVSTTQKHVLATRAVKLSTATSSYTRNDQTLEGGVTIHEYQDASGYIFAVSWSGPYHPDLKDLLGDYFDVMKTETDKNPRANRTRLSVKRSDVQISIGGHMGAFHGKAWIPAKLPSGFTPDDIQ